MSLATHASRPGRPAPAGPLLPLVGADVHVPLVTGGSVPAAHLDVAASAPALRSVAERVERLLPHYASVNRGAGFGSAVSAAALDGARGSIAAFVGARPDDVVQLVRHTTDGLNLLASAVPGDVVTLDVEHHANLLPWARVGGRHRTVAARGTLAATVAAVEAELARQPAALLAVTGASNVTGELLPVAALTEVAHRHGARIAVDGAQWVPHRRVDLAALDVDYLALSGHKLYAPFGAGALVGRPDWLAAAPPYLAGGGAVRSVTLEDVAWADVPARHEAGTPNVVGAVALGAACATLAALDPAQWHRHEEALGRRLRDGLAAVPGVRVLRLWDDASDTLALATFTLAGRPAELVAQYLSAEHGIAVRAGRFCAHPLLARLNAGDTAVRAGVGVGTSSDDVDRLLAALEALVARGPRWTYDAAHRPAPDPRPLPDWLGE